MQDEVVKQPKGNVMGTLKLVSTVLVVFALGAGATAFAATQYPEALGLSKGQAQAQAEVDMLVTEVGKLLALPSDEKPTVATITDVEKLKEQAFFKNAMNQDKVLIYTNAKKAILYRPSEKKVVEVGAVNINQQPRVEATPVGSQVVTPTQAPVTPVVSPRTN
jgi:hypothetical protein